MPVAITSFLNIPFQYLRFLYFLIRRRAFSPTLKKQNPKAAKKCLIIGNGPSIGQHLEKTLLDFEDNELFVVNNFVSSPLYTLLKPAFYVFADPMYWLDLDNPVSKKDKEMLQVIKEVTDWKLTILIPLSAARNFSKVFGNSASITLVHYNDIIVETGLGLDYMLYSRSLACPYIQNVMVQSIFLALNLGFKEINLIGADHSWTKEIRVNHENVVCLIDTHFYDQGQTASLQPWISYLGKPYKMHEILNVLAKAFNGYHILEKYSRFLSAKIYNYTPESFIDSFEKRVLKRK